MGDSFAIGIPESEPKPSPAPLWRGLAHFFVILAVVAGTAAILVPNIFMGHHHGGGQLTACKSNCKSLAMALEMYASDFHGHYPASLQVLTAGNYLKTIPNCPAAGAMTYTNYQVTQNPDRFSFACVGNNHAKSYVGYSLPSDNYPQYNSEVGLVDHP